MELHLCPDSARIQRFWNLKHILRLSHIWVELTFPHFERDSECWLIMMNNIWLETICLYRYVLHTEILWLLELHAIRFYRYVTLCYLNSELTLLHGINGIGMFSAGTVLMRSNSRATRIIDYNLIACGPDSTVNSKQWSRRCRKPATLGARGYNSVFVTFIYHWFPRPYSSKFFILYHDIFGCSFEQIRNHWSAEWARAARTLPRLTYSGHI